MNMASTGVTYNTGDGVIYVNTDRNVIFDTKETPTSGSEGVPIVLNTGNTNDVTVEENVAGIGQNYLVVLDKNGASQDLPMQEFEGAIIIKPDNQESVAVSPMLSGQSSAGSLLKPNNGDLCQQQAVLVVGEQFGSDNILIDPEVFAAYTNPASGGVSFSVEQTANTTNDSLHVMPQESFVHCKAAPLLAADFSEKCSNDQQNSFTTLHAGPTNAVFQKQIALDLVQGDEMRARESSSGCEGIKVIQHVDVDQDKLQLQKNQLKMLEKSHLQHHVNETQRKITAKMTQMKSCGTQTGEEDLRCEETLPRGEAVCQGSVPAQCDDMSVFSSITAKINPSLLAEIPGCMKFLLDSLTKTAQSEFKMSSESETDCVVTGNLQCLIQVYNDLRKLSNMTVASFLTLIKPRDEKSFCSQGVTCTLLQPFISSRGRQPKYSSKVRDLGYTTDFESLMYIDEADAEEKINISSKQTVQKKRKRGRPKQNLSKRGRKQKVPESSAFSEDNPSVSDPKMKSEVQTSIQSTSFVPDMTDPLQQRLLAEQIRYRKRQLQGKSRLQGDDDGLNHSPCQSEISEEDMTQPISHSSSHKGGLAAGNMSIHGQNESTQGQKMYRCDICAAYQTDSEEVFLRHLCQKHGAEPSDGGENGAQHVSINVDANSIIQHSNISRRSKREGSKLCHICPECKRTLRSKMHLRRHMKDVHGPDLRPHLCDTCGKAFKRTDALKQHKILHESPANRVLPFSCTTCKKAFRSMAHLKEHTVIHTSERPYLCQYCGASFKTQAVQKRHILTLHIKPRAHVCAVCCRQFNTKHALQRHEATHVKEEEMAAIDNQNPALVTIDHAMDPGQDFLQEEKEKRTAISSMEAHVAAGVQLGIGVGSGDGISEGNAHIEVDNATSLIVQDIIEGTSASSAMEDQIGSEESQRLQQAYIQGTQDGTTLYYFTGELNSL